MDQEVDLRDYIAVLLKYKVWIIGLAVVASVATAIVSLLLPPRYEATALVAVAEPQYEMQFDTRIRSVSDNVQPPYKAYPLLAASDEVLAALIADLGETLEPEERTVQALQEKLRAQGGSDPSIIRLTVKNGDPRQAAMIANRWAERFVQAANDLYAQSSGELAFFVEQQAEAQAALDQADRALIDFQARNPADILETRLKDALSGLDSDLDAIRSFETTIQDTRALRERLRAHALTAPASPGDELTALLIQIAALTRTGPRIQLQLSAAQDLDDKTIGDQVAFLDSLISVLEERLAQVRAQAQDREPEILALQTAHQEAQTEQDRLSRAQLIASDTLVSLARKAAEARIAAQDETGEVRLASRATPPDQPVAPRKTLNTLVGSASGLLVGVLAALGIEYWRRS
jgi:uncharacterized protein involved in exopolysaccharide biosynthesis